MLRPCDTITWPATQSVLCAVSSTAIAHVPVYKCEVCVINVPSLGTPKRVKFTKHLTFVDWNVCSVLARYHPSRWFGAGCKLAMFSEHHLAVLDNVQQFQLQIGYTTAGVPQTLQTMAITSVSQCSPSPAIMHARRLESKQRSRVVMLMLLACHVEDLFQ